MNSETRILFALVVALLVGCATPEFAPVPSLSPEPPNPLHPRGSFYIDLFHDQRKDNDIGTTYFGRILGIFFIGNERLHFAMPASEVVQSATIKVLRSQGYRADRLPAASESRSPDAKIIAGRIYFLHAWVDFWWGIQIVSIDMELCLDSEKWCKRIHEAQRINLDPREIDGKSVELWLRKFLEDQLVAFFTSAEFAESLKDTGSTTRNPAATP